MHSIPKIPLCNIPGYRLQALKYCNIPRVLWFAKYGTPVPGPRTSTPDERNRRRFVDLFGQEILTPERSSERTPTRDHSRTRKTSEAKRTSSLNGRRNSAERTPRTERTSETDPLPPS